MALIRLNETCLLESGSASCSGIIIDSHKGYILTHGSLLLPFLDSNPAIHNQLLNSKTLSGTLIDQCPIQVTCEIVKVADATKAVAPGRAISSSFKYASSINEKRFESSGRYLLHQKGTNSRQLTKDTAFVQAVWRSNRFAKSLASLFPLSDNWKFQAESELCSKESAVINGKDEKDMSQINSSVLHAEKVTKLLPYFVLIKLIDNSVISSYSFINPIRHVFTDVRKDSSLVIGCPVFVVGTPFGNLSPAIFINSMSKGVVSNVAGDEEEVILTDARCIPGTEGGAIYNAGCTALYQHSMNKRSAPCNINKFASGMIVAPLCWRSNEWVGMSIGCRLSEVWKSLQEAHNNWYESNSGRISDIKDLIARSLFTEDGHRNRDNQLFKTELTLNVEILKTPPFCVDNIPVVLVQNQGTWGSGLIIHQEMGLVITCSHVVNSAKTVQVRLASPLFTWFYGDVIYATPDGEVFDVALIQLRHYRGPTNLPPMDELTAEAVMGDDSFVLGHAAFGRDHNMRPCITGGIVSKIVYHTNSPVLIQTTCAVHAGASGGPLLNTDGKLLGIIVCNAKDIDSGATYPHVNLSVPVCAFWPAIMSYVKSKNTKHLQAIHVKHLKIKESWTLNASANHAVLSILKSKL